MIDSATTQELPPPTLDTYTPKQLITIINNGAQVGQTHPQYTQVRQIMAEALGQLTRQHLTQNAADSAAAAPGSVPSALVSFGHGASFGLAGDRDYLEAAHKYHPAVATVSDILGAGATTTLLGVAGGPALEGLSTAKQGAVLGTVYGAGRGAATADPGQRLAGAATGGLVGGLTGGVGGKVVGGISSVVKPIIGNIARLLGRSEEQLLGMSESALRTALEKKGFTGASLERAIADARAASAATTTARTAGGVTTTVPAAGEPGGPGRLLSEAEWRQRTEARFPQGQDIAPGMRPKPATTVDEVQARLEESRTAQSAAVGASIPQPSGGVTITPKAAADVTATPQPFAATRQIAGAITQLQEQLGRGLTPEEREKVLGLLLGQRGGRSAHPIWYGSGAPTPRGSGRP